jgi:hypothetical protein
VICDESREDGRVHLAFSPHVFALCVRSAHARGIAS